MMNTTNRIKIIAIFILCGLLTRTAPNAAANQPTPTPTPTPPPKEWQVRGVLAALKDELLGVQYEAIKKAVELGIAEQISDEEIPKIIRLIGYDGNIYNQDYSIAELLGYLGERVSPYLSELTSLSMNQNSSTRTQAIRALGKIDAYNSNFEPELLQFLSDKNIFVRSAAATALGNIKNPSKKVISELIKRLFDDDAGVRLAAMGSLYNFGEKVKDIVPDLIPLLSNNDGAVREAAAYILGNMGESAQLAAPQLIQQLSDKNYNVRYEASRTLGNMGDIAKSIVPKLVRQISDNNPLERHAAATILQQLGIVVKDALPDIMQLFSHENKDVRVAAVEALNGLSESAQMAVPALIRLLSDENAEVREAAAQMLGIIGEPAKDAMLELIHLLSDKNADVRMTVAFALSNIGKPDRTVVTELVQLISSKDIFVRQSAALALKNFNVAAKDVLPELVFLLSDEDLSIRTAAIQALSNIGEAAKNTIPELIPRLSDERSVQIWVIQALGNMRESAQASVKELVRQLSDEDRIVRQMTEQALIKIGQDDKSFFLLIPFILERIYAERNICEERRFLAHFLGGGDDSAERLLKWLGKPVKYPVTLTYNEARETLRVFILCWEYMQKYPQELPDTRADLAEKIMMVATQRNILWTQADLPLLQSLLADLESVNSIHADALRREIMRIEGRKWGVLILQILAAHFCLWLVLLLLYPLSSHIQALLWQPLFRHMFGLFYMPLLLTAVPFLKRWLLRPFRQMLVAEAKLELFDAARYFAEAEVALSGATATQPLHVAVPRLRGQIVIEGDSGLGKTMFARALLQRSRRAAVFLPAGKCAAGIVEAIQAKLPDVAADRALLRKLVYSGTLDLYLDGLNEVSADTRAAVAQFVERSFEGNALLTTQPLEWQPPATARVFVLQPLRRDWIDAYLLSRYDLFAASATRSTLEYDNACRAYLAEAFDPRQPPELLASNQRILSNPMDAVIVAQMLAHGETPSLFRLEEQQYRLMAADFVRLHIGRAFPLPEFAERVYQMRLNDHAALPFADFPDEITCMERHKMAVRRLVIERMRPNSAATAAIETRRLPFELRRQIIALLTALPNMQNQAAQQAFVNSLALDAPLKQGIKIGGASKEFFEMLVETLEGYGTLEDGRDPMEAMLNAAKESVGKERRAACDALLAELRNIEIAPPRQTAPSPDAPFEQWYFRHDKIMDYFLVQTFLGERNELPRKHLSDPRFRGVYFQLAALLPLDEARQLRETLIQYAADTKDHTVSDTFIQLLRPREVLNLTGQTR